MNAKKLGPTYDPLANRDPSKGPYFMMDIATPTFELDAETMAKITEAVTAQQAQGLIDEEAAAVAATEAEAGRVKAESESAERIIQTVLKTMYPMISGTPSPAFNRIKTLHGDSELSVPHTGFNEWMRTGKFNADITEYMDGGLKAAWKEGDDTLGGVTVPDGLAPGIKEKRDEWSIARMAGAETISVSGKVLDVPAEDTRLTDWVLTAEEAAYDFNEGDLANEAITLYKFTKAQKASDELLDDSEVDLLGFFQNRWGRSLGLTENNYFLVGTGSGQPEGVYVGGTSGKTFASNSTIALAETLDVYYALGKAYRQDAVWTMKDSTEKVLRGFTGDPFQLVDTPQGQANGDLESIYNKASHTSIKNAAIGATLKSLIFGSWEFFLIAERSGMKVRFNDQLYMATGQVAWFVDVRFGSQVTQAEAFQYGVHPA